MHNDSPQDAETLPTQAIGSIYLISCALNGVVPSSKRVAWLERAADFDESMLQFCQLHQVRAICALTLKSASAEYALDAAWEHALEFDEYKHALQAAERDVVLDELEQHRIRHMPLKGTILSELYPNPLMREMCDSDILVDETKIHEVNEIMRNLGFKFNGDSASHRAFLKPPFLNFEMHYRLFVEEIHPALAHYFKDVWSLAKPDQDKSYRYHFAPTDFYIYMTLHAYKHYAGAGFGLRTLADEYVMLQKLDGIDFNRADKVMRQLDTQRFEVTFRSLSGKLFDKALLSDDGQALYNAITGKTDVFEPAEFKMLDHVVASGAYGTVSQAAQRRINKFVGVDEDVAPQTDSLDGARYILQRLFPPAQELKSGYPVLRKPAGMALLPGVYIFRILRGITTRRNKTTIELNELRKATE